MILILLACLTPEPYNVAVYDASCAIQVECWEEWGNSTLSKPTMTECVTAYEDAGIFACRDKYFHADRAAECLDYISTVDCDDYYSDIMNNSKGIQNCNDVCKNDEAEE